MEVIFIYLAKSIFISFVFLGYYKLFLEGKEFHHYNRFYLLIAVVFSIFLPMVRVNWFAIQPDNDNLILFLNYFNGNAIALGAETNEASWVFYLGIFIAGISMLFLGKVIYGIFRLMLLKSKYPKEKHENYTMVFTDLPSAPFTFLKNIFWNNSIDIKTTQGDKIFLHELAHIEEKHTIDRLFLQFVKAIFWFNPMFYLFHRELILIHEYLADQKAIKNKDSNAFAAMLLSYHYNTAAISGTSPFFNSTIKKRLLMLKKKHNTKFSYTRRVLALPLLFAMSFVYMVQAKNKEVETSNKMVEAFVQEHVNKAKDTIKEKKTIQIESKNVEKETFLYRNPKNEDLDIFLDGKKISKEEMEVLAPETIKNIDIKKGDKPSIHIYLKKDKVSDISNNEKVNTNKENSTESSTHKTVAISSFVKDGDSEAQAKNTYYIDGREVTEEEMKESHPVIYEKVKNKEGKHISASSTKVMHIKEDDGKSIKIFQKGDDFDKENVEIYLDGKKISREEMLNINQDKIKEVKMNKSNHKKRIEITLK